jgi:hypothetical protein
MDERSRDRLSGEKLEEALAALLYDESARARLRTGEAADPRFAAIDADELEEAARAVRRMVRGRTHRGTGGFETWFPRTIAAWRAAHPDDVELDDLLTRFCASPSCRTWSELGGGISLEEALYRFFLDEGIGSAAIANDEATGAVVRALAIAPEARFEWPANVRRAPGGCYALARGPAVLLGAAFGPPPVLHAAIDGTYVHGPVTDLVAELLEGEPPDVVAGRHALGPGEIDAVIAALCAKRLIAPAAPPAAACPPASPGTTDGAASRRSSIP